MFIMAELHHHPHHGTPTSLRSTVKSMTRHYIRVNRRQLFFQLIAVGSALVKHFDGQVLFIVQKYLGGTCSYVTDNNSMLLIVSIRKARITHAKPSWNAGRVGRPPPLLYGAPTAPKTPDRSPPICLCFLLTPLRILTH